MVLRAELNNVLNYITVPERLNSLPIPSSQQAHYYLRHQNTIKDSWHTDALIPWIAVQPYFWDARLTAFFLMYLFNQAYLSIFSLSLNYIPFSAHILYSV